MSILLGPPRGRIARCEFHDPLPVADIGPNLGPLVPKISPPRRLSLTFEPDILGDPRLDWGIRQAALV